MGAEDKVGSPIKEVIYIFPGNEHLFFFCCCFLFFCFLFLLNETSSLADLNGTPLQ